VLVFLEPTVSERAVKARITEHLMNAGLFAELMSTRISLKGGRDGRGWINRK